jgi:hypothetical protein
MVEGPRSGLDGLDKLEAEGRLPSDHRLPVVRAHLLETAGDPEAARSAYESAANLARNVRQQRHLRAQGRPSPTHMNVAGLIYRLVGSMMAATSTGRPALGYPADDRCV